MASQTSETITYKPTAMVLSDLEIAAVVVLADKLYDGNRSMAVRNMIKHFITCQFPLLGLSPEIEQPVLKGSK